MKQSLQKNERGFLPIIISKLEDVMTELLKSWLRFLQYCVVEKLLKENDASLSAWRLQRDIMHKLQY